MEILRVLSFCLGLFLAGFTMFSAIRTFVLPRSANDWLSRRVFLASRFCFHLALKRKSEYLARDRIMALYAPVSLVSLPAVWLALVMAGYMCMFWAVGVNGWRNAFNMSGSSLLTLGFFAPNDLPTTILAFSEATIGLFLVAVLISYLPTMYAAFSRREQAVTLLAVRAGNPPSAREMILRFNRLGRMDKLAEMWQTWEVWFTDLEESHTSLAALSFFRSPQPDRSWVTAAGTILDAASLYTSTLDVPKDPQADLCIRAGFLALREIARFFKIPFNPDPQYPSDPISITRGQFEETYNFLQTNGVALKPDRDQAWRDFAGWRVNYDFVLLTLARLTMAPEAPWLKIPQRPPWLTRK